MMALHRFRFLLAILLVSSSLVTGGQLPQQAADVKPIRIGMIGLDSSHVIAFTEMLNDPSRPDHVPGATVVAAFRGGSPDIESSATRIEKFTAEMKNKWRVELVDSIEELCRKVDAIIIASVDGRSHLPQARVVFASKKRVFIDKPFAGSLRDARRIVQLARESGTPFFSSSSLRFAAEIQSFKRDPKLGKVLGAFSYSPAPFEPHHPDLFWYGIHGIEILYTLMGKGCESVTRVYADGADVVVGRWKDGRTGVFRGIREGARTYGAVAFGTGAVMSTTPPMKADYRGLVVEIVKFFQTGVPPVLPEETLEMMAFMEAADASKARNGVPVALEELSQH